MEKERLSELRKDLYEEIENFVRAMEKKITGAGVTPFEIGFMAIKGNEVFNDHSCQWDIEIDNLICMEGKKPLPWINSEKYPDFPHIRTAADALRSACDIGPYIGFQVDGLKYLREGFIDDIWPELEDPTKEQFSQMMMLFDNCIEKLEQHADDLERRASILIRNQQRIALGLDIKKEAA